MSRGQHFRPLRARPTELMALLALLLTLQGCASLSPDAGMAEVQALAREHLGETAQLARHGAGPVEQAELARRVAELLAQPLSAESAVQLALLNNRGLQAAMQGLGIADAERVQASRLPNPGFSIARLRRGDEREIERGLSFELGHWLALPWTRPLEARRFAARQRELAQQVLQLAAATRKAFYTAVAAEQGALYLRDVAKAAEAGAELGRRMVRAGNWTALEQARERGFHAEALLRLARAETASLAARERLNRHLGLWGEQTAYRLPDRLPELPEQALDGQDLEQRGMRSRLDLQAARLELEARARGLGLSRASRFVNLLELGVQRNSSNEAGRQSGYEIGIEIPLFDSGDARLARAEALYLQSVHLAAQQALEARSELREAYQAYRSAHDIARHYREEIVPTARLVSEEKLLRYNGMFISVFELLADARAQIASVHGSIEAQRDFWLAEADLQLALVGRPTLTGPGPSEAGSASAAGPAH